MGLISKFLSVGSATMVSRVLGFIREALIAAFLGAGPVADAFYAAFRFPNLFRRLFAEGAFNAAFIPMFAEKLERDGAHGARQLAEQILSVLILVLLVISAGAMIFMPFLVNTVVAPKFSDPEKIDLTIFLTRIMFPYLAAMSVVAMLSGILNSFRKYFLAALAPVLLNIVVIGVLIGAWGLGFDSKQLGVAMAWGVVIAGFLQTLLLIFGVWKNGFGLSLSRPKYSSEIGKLLTLAFPTAIAAGIAQVNLLVGQAIASGQDGAIAIINYADRLMQLPLGIIAVSIGVVLLPELTRALNSDDSKQTHSLQNRSVEFGLGLMVPAAVGLYLIPAPLIALVYERGAFTREVTEITSQVLAAFSLGLPAVVLTKIFQPAYYARKDMRTPMWFAGANAITNIILAFALFPKIGVVGLGYAFAIASWVNVVLLGGRLLNLGHYKPDTLLIKNCLGILTASVIMGVVIYFADQWIGYYLIQADLIVRIFSILSLITFAGMIYFSIVFATGAIPKEKFSRILSRNKS